MRDLTWEDIYREKHAEAVQEIERLRAEIETQRAEVARWVQVAAENNAQLKMAEQNYKLYVAEIARMRAALEEIALGGEIGMKPDYNDWLTFHAKVAQIARRALASVAERVDAALAAMDPPRR
jgi:hypothetical protein